jgi:prevent-host-death family protein
MPYTVHQAKTNFSRLLKEAEAGKEVIVMRGSTPIAKLVALTEPAAKVDFRRIGGFEGLIQCDESVFNPLTDEEMIEYGFDNPDKDARFAVAFSGVRLEPGDAEVANTSTPPAKQAK